MSNKKKVFYCPVNGWDCSYWRKDGTCSMIDEGDNPLLECDDASIFVDYGETLDDWLVERGNA